MLRSMLAIALLGLPAVAHADWHEASTDHFVVYSEGRLDKLKELATQLERFDKLIRHLRGAKDEPIGPVNRLNVYVVGDTSAVAELAGDGFAAGFYRPRAGESLAIVPRSSGDGSEGDLNSRQILLHEYAHHMMWSLSPDVAYPSWYIEGSAEMLATARYDKDGSIVVGLPPQYRSASLLDGNWLPADKLLSADTLKLNNLQREGLYGRGWLLDHYLEFSGEREGQLVAYLVALNSGKTAAEAASVFGDLKMLDRELERYKLTRLKAIRVAPSLTVVGQVTIRKLTPGEAATMNVRIRSKNGVDEKTAPGVYADAKNAAAAYPNDMGAQLVLAEAAYDAKDYAGSEAAADRAIAANPKAVAGYVYKAMSRMAIAQKANDVSDGTWGAIRKIIATGNRIDPQDPKPLMLYYRSFVEQGLPPTENAKDGLYDAFTYAPQDSNLRLELAIMHLNDRKAKIARSLLAPLAYQPHRRGLAEFAARIVAKIDSGDIESALAELDHHPKEDTEGGS